MATLQTSAAKLGFVTKFQLSKLQLFTLTSSDFHFAYKTGNNSSVSKETG